MATEVEEFIATHMLNSARQDFDTMASCYEHEKAERIRWMNRALAAEKQLDRAVQRFERMFYEEEYA